MNKCLTKKPEMIRYFFLLALSAGCFLFTVVRYLITKNNRFFFLNWNLFLAAVPWFISLFISSELLRRKPKVFSIILFLFWFLFFPNTVYIITDLYYLRNHSGKLFWYDLVMIMLFSWSGLLFGFFSMEHIEEILKQKVSKVKNIVITCCFLFICAFGVYLGRDLQWNSWEIFLYPNVIFTDVLDRLIKPLKHARTWSFTLLMGVFLNALYWPVKIIQKKD